MIARPEDRSGAFERGLEQYAAGRWYDAHESWETLWVREPDAVLKSFLQGLILVAAAMHKHFEQKRPAGAVRLLGRALEKLAALPDEMRGVDVVSLREQATRARAEIEASGGLEAARVPRIVSK